MSETPEPIIVRHTLSRESVSSMEGGCKPLTGKDIHDAYNEVTSPSALQERYAKAGIAFKLTSFEELAERSKELYERMADVLNRKRTESEVRE